MIKGSQFVKKKGMVKQAMTKDFAYYFDADDEDTIMVRRDDNTIVATGFMAENDLQEVLSNKTFTWISKNTKKYFKEITGKTLR